jgi:acyl-CoA synthetase (NDP forming)
LNEFDAKQRLRAAGLAMVREITATSADTAMSAAESLGHPVALKILSADIIHKSDVGGVRLNLRDRDQVRAAFDQVVAAARSERPDARIDGVLVQAQVQGGQPLIVGITRDASFGPVMTVGLGGVLTELFHDTSVHLLPVDYSTALAMIRALKSYPLLSGFRGGPVCDVDAAARFLALFSDWFLAAGDEVEEAELNPVFVLPQGEGAVAVDAVVTLRKPSGEAA